MGRIQSKIIDASNKKQSTGSKIKSALIKLLVVALVIGGTFSFGTFKPNPWVVKRIQQEEDKKMVALAKEFGLHEPDFVFTDNKGFVESMNRCIDYLNWTTASDRRIARDILVAMAIVESAYGTSRFAVEGNALFGVRTWDLDNVPNMKPLAIPNAKFGVRKYATKCQSVADVIDILNRHPAYESFRIERTKQIDKGIVDYEKLVNGLKAWSTNDQYATIILEKIKSLNTKK
jgi:flagellum-specific peptidoglycan hydrolase FlgJ|tara:strand:- start:5918 stop:6613 length:696 start_codon:yes stop_codon:yes gene_type:complete